MQGDERQEKAKGEGTKSNIKYTSSLFVDVVVSLWSSLSLRRVSVGLHGIAWQCLVRRVVPIRVVSV